MKIDKGLFSPEELAQYEALVAKARVEDDAPDTDVGKSEATPENEPEDGADEKEEAGLDKRKDCRKSAEEPKPAPELTAALGRLDSLEKAIEMKECREVAKKYALLGEEEDKLAETLYNMRKSDDASYAAYIDVLDRSLTLVMKSGVFTEIGKSGHGAQGGSIEDKIQAAATEIQKSNTDMSRMEAIAKAWESHPELVSEYDAEYGVK